MLEVLHVPVTVQNMPIAATDLSARTRNLLLRNSLRTLGALDGLSTAYLLLLDRMGPKTVTEIVGYLRCLGTGTAIQETARDYKPIIADLPSHLVHVRISRLALDRRTRGGAWQLGFPYSRRLA